MTNGRTGSRRGGRLVCALLAGCTVVAVVGVETAEPAAAAPVGTVAAVQRLAVAPDPGQDDEADPGTGTGTGAGSGTGSGAGSGAAPAAPAPPPPPEPAPPARPPAPPPPAPAPPAPAPAPRTTQPRADPARPSPSGVARARAAAAAAERARIARQRAAQAAGRAAAAATAAERVRASWERHGRPHQMIIVRTRQVDVVIDGRLSRRAVRTAGTLTLSALDRYVPRSWLTIADGKAVLAAAVVLTPGAVMNLGGDVRALELVGGGDATRAATIHTGGGTLALNGVSITSIDPATQQAVAPEAPGRPFIVVSANGRLDSTDSSISNMGIPALAAGEGRPAVQFNPGSTGSLVRTSLMHNSSGLVLSRSEGVRLEQVTAGQSTEDGVVFKGDRGTTMSGVRAIGNGANGVLVTGQSSDRVVTGVATAENGAHGIAVMGQTGARITGATTTSDTAGGLRLSRSTDTVVTDFTATNQPIGIFTHVNTIGVVLDRVHTTGGRRGIVVEKSTQQLSVVSSTFEGARVAGLAIGGQDIDLNAVRVEDSRAGVRIERGASDIRLNGVIVNGGQDGIVATSGTQNVVVTGLVANHVGADAVRTFSADAQIIGGRITGGATGLDLGAATTIVGTSIDGADEGIHSRSTSPVHADRVSVDAFSLGVNIAEGSPFVLRDSRVHALEAVRGEIGNEGVNDFSLPPLNLLGAIGLPLILLAFVLELAHAVRQRRFGGGQRHAPPSVAVSTP